ncbi:MAG: transposase [Candidatus Sericytochromatia bacterium]|nr:transposase [Candidatus Sericytochromatia bacterium]
MSLTNNKKRVRINLWISDDAISNWICRTDTRNYYSDASIELCLTLMSVYHLNLRSV